MLPIQIQKLDQAVINRIAAGEVIQRPANALKEMIENSLDAKSTNIQITVKNGGLKYIQIQDNGTGIRKDDLEIVCERFTTSKLREFEDLHSIATYGFRGEALASISHVAHLTIQSKTCNDQCAFRASYKDGKLVEEPKPTAGNPGTQITVEDLFYNMNVRKQALKSASEEYQKVSDVVGKYAIHNASIGFGLKKHGDKNDIRTPTNSNQIDNIRTIYGNLIARELVEFTMENAPFKFKAHGYMTNVNYSTKKFIFLLFINHRLVDCQGLKKCIDQIYVTYLPKNAHPFVYLSLELNPRDVDVNVHPTKHEVHFLHEDQIINAIAKELEAKLLGSNNSRVFFTQAKLPCAPTTNKEKPAEKIIYDKNLVRTDSSVQKLEKFFGTAFKKSEQDSRKIEPQIIKSELENRKIEQENRHDQFENRKSGLENGNSYLENGNSNLEDRKSVLENRNAEQGERNIDQAEKNTEQEERSTEQEERNTDQENRKSETKNLLGRDENIGKNKQLNILKQAPKMFNEDKVVERIVTNDCVSESPKNAKGNTSTSKSIRTQCELTSVLELRKELEDNCHKTLRELFAQHVFVGCIDSRQALIQHSTKLYLCNTYKLMKDLFYQFILHNFQNFGYINLSDPLPLYKLALLALDMAETGWTQEDGDKKELAGKVAEILTEKGEMLLEYFSMEIDKNGNLKSLPLILDNHVPEMAGLPMYILRLATEVQWDSEKECFRSFANETARYYAQLYQENKLESSSWNWTTEHVFYPALKEYFLPPKTYTENAGILQIANLPDLYKVFERC